MSERLEPIASSVLPIGFTLEQEAQIEAARASWQCPAGHTCLPEHVKVSFEGGRVIAFCGRRGLCLTEAFPPGGP